MSVNLPQGFYSVAIEGGYPMVRGPYPTWEVQVATIRHLIAEAERCSGEHAGDVFFLDIREDGPHMGRLATANGSVFPGVKP